MCVGGCSGVMLEKIDLSGSFNGILWLSVIFDPLWTLGYLKTILGWVVEEVVSDVLSGILDGHQPCSSETSVQWMSGKLWGERRNWPQQSTVVKLRGGTFGVGGH